MPFTINAQNRIERWLLIRYLLLTAFIFLPLFWAFVKIRNVYPVTAWTVMMAGGDLQRGRSYYMLRGETIDGLTIDIPAIELTNAMYSRNWGMVNAVAGNESLKLKAPHPANQALIAAYGAVQNLPFGVRMPDLLQGWGEIYNNRQSPSSPLRLKAIRIDMYRWNGGSYSNFATPAYSWRQEL
ncbi:MAG: hypothetical protein ABR555_00850 [Pyrinomonadaceae bacterium]